MVRMLHEYTKTKTQSGHNLETLKMSRNMYDFILKAVPVDWRQTHAGVVHFFLKSEV